MVRTSELRPTEHPQLPHAALTDPVSASRREIKNQRRSEAPSGYIDLDKD
ncbi:hypothetical protein [Nocardia heshunensis]